MTPVEVFRENVESFVAELLTPYTAQLKKQKEPPRTKEVNDTVWRTVVLGGFEVAILDSPLLQRLRYVRQLGVAHWIYPAATHSRLEHSIGALHQLQRVLDALNTSGDSSATDEHVRISVEYVNLLRFAALCHDIGHGVMSHVSENAFKELESVELLRLDLEDFFDKEKIQLGEAVAYFMLGSPAFRELLEVAQRVTQHRLPLQTIELLQKAITGKQIHQRIPLLQELISGPFDVDKLDYMTRDAYMAGIPVVTDIDRLVRKIRLVVVPTDKLPKEIARVVTNEHPTYYVQAIALSGARTLDELMIGRALLFDKVYRHQKVRACESMVSQTLLAIARLCDEQRAAVLPLHLADEELLRFERSVIERAVGRSLSETEWNGLAAARDVATRLRHRDLFVRAYAYAHKLPQDPFANDPDQKRGLEALRRENAQPHARQEMIAGMCKLLCEMRRAGARFAEQIPDESLARYIALDNPPQQSTAGEIARAYLAVHGNALMRFRDDSADTSPWSNAYAMTRDLGFVFCARELAPAVFLAAEAYVRMKYSVRTPPSALVYSKTSSTAVDELRALLTKAGFYDDKPPDLRFPVHRLKKADVITRIDSVVLKLGEFQGLVSEGEEVRAVKVSRDRVLAWLQQFRTDEDADAALRVLEAIRMVSRAEVHHAVRHFLLQNPSFKDAVFCPLGSPKDSSHILTYFVNDLRSEFAQISVASLPDALTQKEAKPIVFLDDFLSTGKQAVTILKQWLDKVTDAPLDEPHVLPLSKEAQAALKARDIGFVFAAGTSDGKTRLEKELSLEGIKPTIHIHLDASALPRAFGPGGVAFSSPEQGESFSSTCSQIGAQLLSNYEGKERSTTWIAERSLGYGNSSYLLVFPYNAPTATLTALWCGGTVDGFAWLPLVPRRPKT